MAHIVKHVLYDGLKSIPLDEGDRWTSLNSGDDAPKTTMQDLFTRVAWLHRGVDLRAGAVASMPFVIMKGETDFDSSDEWDNKVGFMENPAELLWLIEASLVLTNRAYLFRDLLGKRTIDMRYVLPTGARPKLDPREGLVGFYRTVANREVLFPPEKFVYFWKPDPYKEIGPSDSSPATAAAAAAGVLMNVDDFAGLFFKRGAIKATILAVGASTQSGRDELKAWFTDIVSGIKNAWSAHVINADEVKPSVIGEGIESLQHTPLTREKREDISTALGIPQTLVFSDAATNATAGEDQLSFLKHTVVPECEFIASILNEQVFEPMGLRFEFRPETLDEFQEDESKRAVALAQLVTAGFDLLTACEILGYELTDEQIAKLEAKEAEDKANRERMAQLAQMAVEKPPEAAPTAPQDAPGRAGGTEPPNGPAKGDPRVLGELTAWERFAVRGLGRRDGPSCPSSSPPNRSGGSHLPCSNARRQRTFTRCSPMSERCPT